MGTRERSDTYILMEKFEPQLTIDYQSLSYFDILSDDEKCIRCYALPRIFNSDLCVECEDVMEQTDHPAVNEPAPPVEHVHRKYGIVDSGTAFRCFSCKMISVNGKWYAEQEDNSGYYYV